MKSSLQTVVCFLFTLIYLNNMPIIAKYIFLIFNLSHCHSFNPKHFNSKHFFVSLFIVHHSTTLMCRLIFVGRIIKWNKLKSMYSILHVKKIKNIIPVYIRILLSVQTYLVKSLFFILIAMILLFWFKLHKIIYKLFVTKKMKWKTKNLHKQFYWTKQK